MSDTTTTDVEPTSEKATAETETPAEAAPAPAPNYLDADATALAALADVVRTHPDLPPLIARSMTDEGLRAMPYLPLRPVAALRAWVEALPGRVYVRHAPDPIGGGTELHASATLNGRALVLTVTAWWSTPREFTAANGLITRAHLAQLARWERDEVEHGVAPAADSVWVEPQRTPSTPPPVAPTVADPARGKL